MRALEFDVKKAEVKMLLEKFSKDASGEVNYEEFLEISN
jgi:Ca2+-binding EF-hand superfamily protein